MLAATLPFGGMTLFEYQARLLIAAGVGHILVAVGRVTPALLGAVSRVTKRNVTVDVVRSAEEAAARAHPLSTIIVVADGLVTTDVAVLHIAGETPEAILVTADTNEQAAVERVDAARCWAGMAAISAGRLAEIAALPSDYDFQSTLLRVCVQEGAHHVALPASAVRAGHGVERNAEALASRSNAVLAALANQRIGWADRYVFTPITRLSLPLLVRKQVPNWSVMTAGFVLGLAALVLLGLRHPAWGLGVALLSIICLSAGSLLSWLRGDDTRARWQETAIIGLCALSGLLAAVDASLESGTLTAVALGAMLVAVAAIARRVPVRRRPWFGNAPSYLLLLTPFAIAGYITIGLAAIAVYALATLAVAVEGLREDA